MENNTLKQSVQNIATYLAFAYAVIYLYIELSHWWVPLGIGYLTFNPKIIFIEIPLAILFSCFFFFPHIHNRFARYIIPIVPILILYALFDGFFNYMARSPTLSDFQNMSVIYSFSPVLALLVITLYLSIAALTCISILLAIRQQTIARIKYSLLARISLLLLMSFLASSDHFYRFQQNNFKYTVWSQEDTIRENGKFSSFFFFLNQEKVNFEKLQSYAPQGKQANVHQTLFPGQINHPPNIHIVVMESFIDPRLIKEIQVDNFILAKEILPYLNSSAEFSYIASPIYGGGTAQAEFELLTGLPALAKINQIEFNVMTGGKIDSFVSRLNKIGYRTLASIAPSPDFFNSKRAYQSLGFEQIDYLYESKKLIELTDGGAIFDGDLLQHNITMLKRHFSRSSQPIFNYILGMYGHLPFKRNLEKRPDVVVIEHSDDRLQRITNQFYYRTKALGHYLEQLFLLDPNSIVLITSDHLPSVLSRTASYRFSNKQNIALLFENGQKVELLNKSQYEIPWLIWDLMSGKPNPRPSDFRTIEDMYFSALSKSINGGILH